MVTGAVIGSNVANECRAHRKNHYFAGNIDVVADG